MASYYHTEKMLGERPHYGMVVQRHHKFGASALPRWDGSSPESGQQPARRGTARAVWAGGLPKTGSQRPQILVAPRSVSLGVRLYQLGARLTQHFFRALIYNSLRSVDTEQDVNELMIESFDSVVSVGSPWECMVVDSVTNATSISSRKRWQRLSPFSLPLPVAEDVIELEEGIPEGLRASGTAARQSADATTEVESADELFGKMVGVMISRLSEKDKGRAKIHIMSYLCNNGYKIKAPD